jgi:hypothetical protein
VSDALSPVDAELRACARLLTLDPQRSRASLPGEMVTASLRPDDPPALRGALARGTTALVRAMLRAFPNNLLWDLDLLVATHAELGRRGDDAEALLRRIAQLQDLFGEHGPIRFRYVHDFVYGFDWAKWVAKAPAERAGVGPYDPAFIERMFRRARELTGAIAAGSDATYPPLPHGRIRNPFGFSREPEDELALHRALAAAGALPVEAWRIDAQPRWDSDFAARRRAHAERLGLHTSSSS